MFRLVARFLALSCFAHGWSSRLRVRAAQPGRNGLGAGDRRPVGRGERAGRARRRPRARLHAGGVPSGEPVDVLTGFVKGKNLAMGRPVGVALDTCGGLLVADDVGNAVWRLTSTNRSRPAVAGPG